MARARNIKPSFFQNDALGELPPLARLLFVGMWTIADFKGCLEFRPKRIKAQLLPYDDCSIEELASTLDKSGFISMYSVRGQLYAKIVNFERHQNPHKNEREAGSDCPDISEKDCEINELSQDGKNREQDGTARADSLFPLTDSLLLIPDSVAPVADLPAPAKKTKADARATRLPQDWRPSPADVEYCKTERPDLLPSRVAQNFFDYWTAKSGKDATKLDWSATWRMWVRNEKAGAARPSAAPAEVDAARQAANAEAKRRLGIDDGRTIDAQ